MTWNLRFYHLVVSYNASPTEIKLLAQTVTSYSLLFMSDVILFLRKMSR